MTEFERARHKAACQLWRARNSVKNAEAKRNWRAKNAERVRQAFRNAYAKNPVRFKLRVYRRRSAGNLTYLEWQEILQRFGNICLRCLKSKVKLTIDHVKPISKGGETTVDNVQPLCLSCNMYKRDREVDYRF